MATLITATLVLTMVQTSAVASPSAPLRTTTSLADLGACVDAGAAYHGGIEYDVVGTTTGAVSRVYTKNPDLCNPQQDPPIYSSGSSSWVMLSRHFDPGAYGRWYQVGNTKRPPPNPETTCPVYFMQYNPGTGPANIITDFSTQCTASVTWYRFDLKLIGSSWHARVIVDSTNQVVWDAPRDPTSLAWSPNDAEYQSEVFNATRDQAGGSNASRLTYDAARWYTSTGTVVWANMQGIYNEAQQTGERICVFCGGSPPNLPYNSNWIDGNTFEIWTDGF